ncbi:MAG: hypothetical protein HY784_11320, partial [Chloroflexi bacterium]|nr:hypothetical protein [Chloroflexota bacterium]
MKKPLLAIFVLLLWLVATPAWAQSGVALSRLEVDLWPEYDRPGVLVLYRITLDPAVAVPAALKFRIPAVAGQPNAVAGKDASGALLNIPYTTAAEADWLLLTFTSESRDIQIEYYDPGLKATGDLKTFTFNWLGDYAVSQLSVQVQQPAGASNLQTSPALSNQVVGGDGLTYLNGDVGAAPAGQTWTLSLSYQKSGAGLSVQSVRPASGDASSGGSPFAT